jgi:hypothetical protein
VTDGLLFKDAVLSEWENSFKYNFTSINPIEILMGNSSGYWLLLCGGIVQNIQCIVAIF